MDLVGLEEELDSIPSFLGICMYITNKAYDIYKKQTKKKQQKKKNGCSQAKQYSVYSGR